MTDCLSSVVNALCISNSNSRFQSPCLGRNRSFAPSILGAIVTGAAFGALAAGGDLTGTEGMRAPIVGAASMLLIRSGILAIEPCVNGCATGDDLENVDHMV